LTAEGAPDRELAERFCRQRDEAAFRILYRRHTPLLFRLAHRLAGAAAEDVVQDAWVRAARGLPGFRWEAKLSTWLAGIVVNRCREEWRTAPGAGAEPMPERAGPPPTGDVRIDLERAVAALAPGFRAVLLLHDVEGYSHEEIAEVLGVAPGTSKSQLSRARRAVRAWLGGEEGDRGRHAG
jgi:RNA polymerase sigma-70 factor (ECF subfamily)